MPRGPAAVAVVLLGGACTNGAITAHDGSAGLDASNSDSGFADASGVDDSGTRFDAGSISDASTAFDAGGADAGPCTTVITYGNGWIHPPNHPGSSDSVSGNVTWDGTCTDSGGTSYAVLSNGWQPYFQGNGSCVIALDTSAPCGANTGCTTRVTYGAAWMPPPNHPASYDDVSGRVFTDGVCHPSGSQSYANLSNGWTPYFTGSNGCELSFEYTNCGGLYANPVIPGDCPDPGVVRDGAQYVLTCTSGNAADAYPIYTSSDLVNWTLRGHIFPAGFWPSWASGDFWAPEIHPVGSGYVAYFSARNASDAKLSIGAASAPTALGPFADLGQPLIHSSTVGLIDASEITASDGTPYVLWKEDGNAIGQATPIHGQQVSPNGLSLVGSAATLITNDQAWEGAVTEAPFMVERSGAFYLFYSGNAYFNSTYAVGVASAPSPLGPFTKGSGPILVTDAAWVGPGHCAVVDTPAGDTYLVYHAWQSGCVNAAGCGRLVLTDAVSWQGALPSVPLAPSSNSRPMP